jgi:hypothetical protein
MGDAKAYYDPKSYDQQREFNILNIETLYIKFRIFETHNLTMEVEDKLRFRFSGHIDEGDTHVMHQFHGIAEELHQDMIPTSKGFPRTVQLAVFSQPRQHVLVHLRGFVNPRVERDRQAANCRLVRRIGGRKRFWMKSASFFGIKYFFFLATSKIRINGNS